MGIHSYSKSPTMIYSTTMNNPFVISALLLILPQSCSAASDKCALPFCGGAGSHGHCKDLRKEVNVAPPPPVAPREKVVSVHTADAASPCALVDEEKTLLFN